jgi:hypothetical protein
MVSIIPPTENHEPSPFEDDSESLAGSGVRAHIPQAGPRLADAPVFMSVVPCPGCGALFQVSDGPAHRYMESSPGCWAAYGEVLAREYSDPRYMSVHRLTVDAYAVQHPGHASPQSIQSVAVHLIGLFLTLERQWPAIQVTAAIKRAADQATFEWLQPPERRGAITVADVAPAQTPEKHQSEVHVWAKSAWAAWLPHHDQVRAWAKAPGTS